MDANHLWNMFLETGAPEMYLMYRFTKRQEEHDVPNGQGVNIAHQQLQ